VNAAHVLVKAAARKKMKITRKQLRQLIKEEISLRAGIRDEISTSNLNEAGDTASIAASIVGDLKTFKSTSQRMEFIGAALKTLAISVEQLKERIEKLEPEGSDS
tara:strand:+ start:104 stop:418 length:315 start_codon:yes stop_codon:yes gene_type:complete